ncbi:unnamed protein product [Didymodactylos carnosus]|uniref:Glycogen debranching enzyme glucanotransferase domain-containing protein n=1 Tax=Didymodactylos carnosus TaxID=1234261 RepID=A0A814PLW7_9BILA|nr:unnamed protein product [Didymodactylos carnosus]CAF1224653.1 unnamed protein product [Didymodactylos carnosus]CAF3872380.1 unnamed protein product [Didymodactylos carnosus]CAF4032796.1 unnamed protein product [Didymodactylos carnosus]
MLFSESKQQEIRTITLDIYQPDPTLQEPPLGPKGLFCCKKSWLIRFILVPKLVPKNVRLYSNHPSSSSLTEQPKFERNTYTELEWQYPSHGKHDDWNRYVELECNLPGTFHYYFTCDDQKTPEGDGYFLVEPTLEWPDGKGETLPIDCIACQSVLSKSLGKFDDWEERLVVAKQSGYNMIHFTPIQKLYHVSNSSYAITDHHELNPLFGKGVTHDHIKKLVDKMALEWRAFSITDLVYNHAANDFSLILEHPDCTYNLVNSPHLKPGFFLDSILMQFTVDCFNGNLKHRHEGGIPSKIEEYHIEIIHDYLLKDLLPRYKLHEFYMINVEKVVGEFRKLILNTPLSTLSDR